MSLHGMFSTIEFPFPFTCIKQTVLNREYLFGSEHIIYISNSEDLPSKLQFSNLTFINFTGTALSGTCEELFRYFTHTFTNIYVLVVDIECSPAAPCPGIGFSKFDVEPPSGSVSRFICSNVLSEEGLPGEIINL